MYIGLKKTFLAALPLAGLLMLPSVGTAYEDDHHQDRHERFRDWGGDHHDYHHGQKDLHREYHNNRPSSDRSHRRFHRWLKRDHYDFHNDRPDSFYGRHDRGRYRGWDNGRYRDDGWYGNQDWYGSGYGYNRGGHRYYPYR